MIDWGKVIKGLEHCVNGTSCVECPYVTGHCITNLERDALELLKKQEERIKKFELERSWDEYPDTMGKW